MGGAPIQAAGRHAVRQRHRTRAGVGRLPGVLHVCQPPEPRAAGAAALRGVAEPAGGAGEDGEHLGKGSPKGG